MPILRLRKAVEAVAVGDRVTLLATDRGAPPDVRAWCQQTENQFLGVEEADGHYRIHVRKLVPDVKERGPLFAREMSNEDLARRLSAGDRLQILDVREEDEFRAGHVPGAIHIPLLDLSERLAALDPALTTAVICRSGRRSGYACRILQDNGFADVWNVVPGMSAWQGPLER
ncbi:MAG: sulfurtransferase TusA family protein [Clostridia bacterium]|nr:sulfurtransferase TusA family protein [Clostridia bacterium]